MIDYAQQHIVNHIDLVAWIRRHGLGGILLGLAAWALTAVSGYVIVSTGGKSARGDSCEAR